MGNICEMRTSSKDGDRELFITDEECHNYLEMLEQVHRINKVLESKEEQIVTLFEELNIVNSKYAPKEPQVSASPTYSLESEYKMLREMNEKLSNEISENHSTIDTLEKKTDDKRKVVTQLEFDVNVLERESKRLQRDLYTIESLGSNESFMPSTNAAKPIDKGVKKAPAADQESKTDYNSDGSSDTGFSSISSREEALYSLNTLV